MTAQGLEVIDHTIHLTHQWINELAGRLDWASKRSTSHLLRVCLHHIRDHLGVNELAQFSAQLPVMICGFMFEGWVPKYTPIKERNADDFVAFMAQQMGEAPEYRGVDDMKSVFALLNTRISRGEINDIRANLPAPIRDSWAAP